MSQPHYAEYSIHATASDDVAEGAQRKLVCPVCRSAGVDTGEPYLMNGDGIRVGDKLAITPVTSQCGAEWHVCIGACGGETKIFVRLLTSCLKG